MSDIACFGSSEQTPFYRANGDCICPDCGKRYMDHPMDKWVLSFDGYPILHILCNGERVKL